MPLLFYGLSPVFKFSMPPPVARAYGPVVAVLLYAFVTVVSAICVFSYFLMMLDELPEGAMLRTSSGTIERFSLEQPRRGNAVHYALQLTGPDGARTDFRIADWAAGAINQLELARVTPRTPVVLKYHEHGRFGSLRDVYEFQVGERILLSTETAMAHKRADVEARRTSTGPLGVLGFTALLVATLWSFLRYELPVLKLGRPRAGTVTPTASHASESFGLRVAAGLWSFVWGIANLLVERILGLLRVPLLPIRYLGLTGTGALLVFLACSWGYVRWDGQLPQRASLTQVSGTLNDARKTADGRETLLRLVVQSREGGLATLIMHPSNLRAAGLHEDSLPALIGKPFTIEFEQSVFANTLYIHGLAAGGQTHITWERSQERYAVVARNERLAALAVCLLGLILIGAGIWRRRYRRAARTR